MKHAKQGKGVGAALKGAMANKMKSMPKTGMYTTGQEVFKPGGKFFNPKSRRFGAVLGKGTQKLAVPKQRSGGFMKKLEGRLKNKTF